MGVHFTQIHWHNKTNETIEVMTMHSGDIGIPTFAGKSNVNKQIVPPNGTAVYPPDKTLVINVDEFWHAVTLGLEIVGGLAVSATMFYMSAGTAAPGAAAVVEATEGLELSSVASGEVSEAEDALENVTTEQQQTMFQKATNMSWAQWAKIASPIVETGLIIVGQSLTAVKGEFEFYYCKAGNDIFGKPSIAVPGGSNFGRPWNINTGVTIDNNACHIFIAGTNGNAFFKPTEENELGL